MERFIKFLLMLCVICKWKLASGCHFAYHVSSTVAKRQVNAELTIQNFFPDCMKERYASSPMAWKSSVNFALFHSRWYKVTESSICSGDLDSVECWMNQLNQFLSPSSPALEAAKLCTIDYYNRYYGSNKTFTVPLPDALNIGDISSCSDVNYEDYLEDLISDLDETEFETEDETLFDFGELFDFLSTEMICPTCSCDNLYENDDYIEEYDYEDDTTCGDCWITRIATAVVDTSGLRRPASKLAINMGGLQRGKKCSKPLRHDVDEEDLEEFLYTSVKCDDTSITVSVDTCRLFFLGFEKIKELVINTPVSNKLNSSLISSSCFPNIVKRVHPPGKVVVFTAKFTECGVHKEIIENEIVYTYALRSMLPPRLREPSLYLTKQLLFLNVSCEIEKTREYEKTSVHGFGARSTKNLTVNSSPIPINVSITMSASTDSSVEDNVNEELVLYVPNFLTISGSHEGPEDISLHLQEVWLTPDSNPLSYFHYDLVKHGCKIGGPMKADINLITCISQLTSISFPTFLWGLSIDSQELYVHCVIKEYHEQESFCHDRECNENPFHFRKRRVKERPNVLFSLGPFRLNEGFCKNEYCDCEQICFGCEDVSQRECDCVRGHILQDDEVSCSEDFRMHRRRWP